MAERTFQKSSSRDYAGLARQLGIYGKLGTTDLYARCPFHQDSKPSFALSQASGLWICHACGERGNFVNLVMKIYGGTLKQAEEWIVAHADVVRFIESINKTNTKRWKERYDALSNKVMPLYFFNRGFTWQTVVRWGIRWDPEAKRFVIPVLDAAGKMVGTVARTVCDESPKYLNSPGLPRSDVLFGFSHWPYSQLLVVVEGVLDAIWLDQFGYPSIALMGTDLSMNQIYLLQNHCVEKLVWIVDNDEAGQRARQKHITQLLKSGYLRSQIVDVSLPQGKKDVQECDPPLLKTLIY